MCGRYYIPEEDSAEELRAIIDEVNRKNKGAPIKIGEIRPTDVAPVLANNRAMVPSAFAMKWGYSLPDGKVVFNARSESAASRPMFQDGIAQRRCLVPAAYYFEWEKRGREKIKYAIGQNEQGILYMAGIYRLEKGVPVFTILTRAPADSIAFMQTFSVRRFSQVKEPFGSIDLLVNNVGGLGGRQRVSEMETSFMRRVMALNFDSVFFATRAALPMLKKGVHPSIINFSTIAVTNGGGMGASIYAAAKGAVQSYSRALAKDLAEFGIRVNMVSPGTIDTPFHAATDRKLVESWKDSILMKRLGDPREVADVIEFLASEKASFLTGEVIQINGGQAFI